jgi:hypothetical protein
MMWLLTKKWEIPTEVCDGIVDGPRVCVEDVPVVLEVVVDAPGPASPMAIIAILHFVVTQFIIVAKVPKMRALRQRRLGLARVRHLGERRAHEHRRERCVQPGRLHGCFFGENELGACFLQKPLKRAKQNRVSLPPCVRHIQR